MKVNLNSLETKTNIVKNAISIIFGISLISLMLFLAPSLINILTNINEEYEVSDVTIAGVKISKKLKKVDSQLIDSTTQIGVDEIRVTEAKKIVAQEKENLLDEINSNRRETFWIFMNKENKDQSLFLSYFDNSSTPQIGEILTAKTDIYKRTSIPFKNAYNKWEKGEIIGFVKKGRRIKILELEEIYNDGNQSEFWALAENVNN